MIQEPLPNIDIVPDSVPSVREELAMLKSMPFDDFINQAISSLVRFAINLAIAIFVFYVGKFIIRKIYNFIMGILIRRQVDRSLSTFVLSTVKMVMYFILIIIVIGILGIETSSFLALFASAGIAIGMALSGTLQNFAGGVMILLMKPYKVGDYIEAQGYAGTVTEIQIFHTLICTPDNKTIIIPNGGLSTGSINNWSQQDYRRVDWTIAISYGDDIKTAREAMLEIFAADERLVKTYIEDDREERQEEQEATIKAECGDVPEKKCRFAKMFHKRISKRAKEWEEYNNQKVARLIPKVDRSPKVIVSELADSSVNLSARAWTQTSNYWPVYHDINEKIYEILPTKGINFPFPQMDVHITSTGEKK